MDITPKIYYKIKPKSEFQHNSKIFIIIAVFIVLVFLANIGYEYVLIRATSSGTSYVSISDELSMLFQNEILEQTAWIEEAINERPELGHDKISVVFIQDKGLKRSQQMFADLNKHAVKPTKSLNILYDHRDNFSKFIVNLANSIEVFEGRVELEKTTISNRSRKFFTLNGIADATMRFLGISKGRKISEEEEHRIKEFWNEVSKNIPEWQLLVRKRTQPYDLRKEFVHAHTNLLNALGTVGKILIDDYPQDWKEKLRGLKDIDWSRKNPDWEGRLLQKGRMLKNNLGIELASNTILKKCGVTLSEERLAHERQKND